MKNRDESQLSTVNAQLKNGYKQTEVGVIPEDWDVSTFEGIATLERGKFSARPRNDPKYFVGGDIPFIQTGDVTNSNGKISSFSQTLNSEGLKVSKLFPCNTLFFTIAANIGDIGFASFATACPDSLIAITPNNHVDKQWLFHELKSRKAIFESLATQNAQLNINLEKLRPYTLPLPPLPEQRAIATALSDVDALLAAQDKLIAKKRDLKQAAMQQLLTGKQRLRKTGENGEWIVDSAGNPVFFSGEWEVKRLEQIAHIKTGSRNNEDKIETGEYPFFVRSENIERINSYSHDCEAILVPGEGRIGDIFHYINGRFDVHQRVYAITQFNPNVSAQFVHRYMTMHFGVWAMQNTVKATVDSLRLPTFQTFVMRLPPTKEEQTAIAAILSDMDTELAALALQRDKTRALKQGMMQELLTGRIRLVDSGQLRVDSGELTVERGR